MSYTTQTSADQVRFARPPAPIADRDNARMVRLYGQLCGPVGALEMFKSLGGTVTDEMRDKARASMPAWQKRTARTEAKRVAEMNESYEAFVARSEAKMALAEKRRVKRDAKFGSP